MNRAAWRTSQNALAASRVLWRARVDVDDQEHAARQERDGRAFGESVPLPSRDVTTRSGR